MRGADTFTEGQFTMRRPEDFVPKSHPLRSIRTMANQALAKMDRLFAGMYEAAIKSGRPSIAREKLLRTMLLRALQRSLRTSAHGAHKQLPHGDHEGRPGFANI